MAARIADLWWLMLVLATAVFIAVLALLLLALARARRPSPGEQRLPLGDTTFVVVSGFAIPAVILLAVLVISLQTGRAVAEPPTPPTLTIEVIGNQFFWDVRYPEQQVVTANEIHIPVGQTVEVRLLSADVIHSFWVPKLAGKIDLIPGNVNTLWLYTTEPGVYRGQCAEFCGVQHALMGLLVIAEPPDQFAAWVARMQRPAAVPSGPLVQRGQQVFFEAGCALCHTVSGVRGAMATGTVGPDLTHVASRRTLAAAVIENTPENLRDWIENPHEIKPGVRMPPTPLDDERLTALIAYLASLE